MNSNYYQNPMFTGTTLSNGMAIPNQQNTSSMEQNIIGQPSVVGEQSYIENILRLNKGKIGTFYMTFPDSNDWRDRKFIGVIEAAGRDHIIISDPNTGVRHLLLMIYLDYVDFEEPINYSPSFGKYQ